MEVWIKMTELEWSEWFAFPDPRAIPRASGTYEVRWAPAGVPKPIPRFNGADTSGLMYIGKTYNLHGRIQHFKRCVTADPQAKNVKNFHSGVVSFVVFRFARLVNPQDLEFRFCQLPKAETRVCEERLLNQYIMRFLDKPPLNTSIKR